MGGGACIHDTAPDAGPQMLGLWAPTRARMASICFFHLTTTGKYPMDILLSEAANPRPARIVDGRPYPPYIAFYDIRALAIFIDGKK